ncbi:MAG TPA: hypothetical protein VL403_00660 [Candidatus Kryptonia bacterium]|nr:hypothetical protein [Candidatus Kryptonia bacterium]
MLTALLATALVFAAIGLLLYLIALLYIGFRAATSERRGSASSRRGATGGLRVVGGGNRSGPSGGWTTGVERWRIERCIATGRRGDALREQGNLDAALHAYQAGFFLHPVRDRQLATTVANHHTGLLSRLISITEDMQGGTVRLFSLAKVDRLLNERSDLQRRYLANRQSSDRQRQREVDRQLAQNRSELQAALRQLIVEIQGSRPAERLH